jgi:hypothetical protein
VWADACVLRRTCGAAATGSRPRGVAGSGRRAGPLWCGVCDFFHVIQSQTYVM